MATPGFSAEASLGRTVQAYATGLSVSFGEAGVFPALGLQNPPPPPNCPTFGACDSSCMRTVRPCTGGEFQESCCGTGFHCQNGSCVCPAPNTVCGTTCTNVQTDANNCGTCGNSCNGGSCVGGKCDCSTAAGLTLCGTTCVNLQTDASNCGSCGHQCIQGVGCVDGLCQCPQGQS